MERSLAWKIAQCFLPIFFSVIDISIDRGRLASVAMEHAAETRILAFEPLPWAVVIFRRIFAGDLDGHIPPGSDRPPSYQSVWKSS